MEYLDPIDLLLSECQSTYAAHPALAGFAAFPTDLTRQSMTAHQRAACADLLADTSLTSRVFPALLDSVRRSAPHMHWRETYKDGSNETAFMARLVCFSIIGEGGPYASERARLFVVYMPPHLYYPWHSHPAEEAYLVIAGQARFQAGTDRDHVLREGQIMTHAHHEPHAITTGAEAMLSLVVWRSHLAVKPVLVPAPKSQTQLQPAE